MRQQMCRQDLVLCPWVVTKCQSIILYLPEPEGSGCQKISPNGESQREGPMPGTHDTRGTFWGDTSWKFENSSCPEKQKGEAILSCPSIYWKIDRLTARSRFARAIFQDRCPKSVLLLRSKMAIFVAENVKKLALWSPSIFLPSFRSEIIEENVAGCS